MRLRTLTVFTLLAAAVGMSSPASANLLVNGSFESGDFSGWTQIGNTGFTGVTGIFGGVPPEDGNFQAFFGAVNSPGGISQTVATVPGASYSLSFWLFNFGGTPSSYEVDFGGSVLTAATDPGPFPYTHYQFNVTAAAALSTVSFSFQQNPSYFLLDNVQLNTPEPSTLAIGGVGGLLALAYGVRRRRRAT
jgi:hypothetical protein